MNQITYQSTLQPQLGATYNCLLVTPMHLSNFEQHSWSIKQKQQQRIK